jgi:DNA-binding response OmpR family regulator
MDIDGMYLDRSKNTAEWQGKTVTLSQKEFLLLTCLTEKKEQIVSREKLLEILWDDVHFIDDNTLTVNVTRVRKKLREIGIAGAIETVRGRGYRLNDTWGSRT